jgi:hypothetical protein
MIYTHVMQRGGKGIRGPLDQGTYSGFQMEVAVKGSNRLTGLTRFTRATRETSGLRICGPDKAAFAGTLTAPLQGAALN